MRKVELSGGAFFCAITALPRDAGQFDDTSTRSELETEQTKRPAKEPSVIMGEFLLRR
jgi:hypothetical protein